MVGDEDERTLAEKTLRLLPPEIPAARVTVPGTGSATSVASLGIALYLAGLAGEAKGVDPGAPHVPEFGRKLYHLNAYTSRRRSAADRLEDRAAIAIERKSGCSVATLERLGLLGGFSPLRAFFMREGLQPGSGFASILSDLREQIRR